MKFVSSDIGYLVYENSSKIYKTLNGGSDWTLIYDNFEYPYRKIYNFEISKNYPYEIYASGASLYSTPRPYLIKSSSDFSNDTTYIFDGLIEPPNFKIISGLSIINSDNSNFVKFQCNDGLYNLFNDNSYVQINSSNLIRGIAFYDANIGYGNNSDTLKYTSNGGVNWNKEYFGRQYNSNIVPFYDICYVGGINGNIYTRKLSTNFQTYFDNQSTPSSIIFDGTQFASPSSHYLRGGISTVISNLPLIINPNQSNEKLFYKWSDGDMNLDNQNFYFDRSGTQIANYYKTKQIASTPVVINNMSQTNSL